MRPREVSRSVELFAALTPTLLPATHTNSYAVGTRDVLLVEPATPYVDEQRAWIAWARALSSKGRRALAIVATHHHLDHVGGVDVFCKELGLPLWAHRETTARIAHPVVRELVDDEVIVLDGPIPEAWRVLHTPGHAPGHVCLYDEATRTAIVGDMVASVGTILIAPGDGDMQLYLEQLERLEKLGAAIALAAHGDPIDAPSTVFRRTITHRLMRETRVRAVLESIGGAGATPDELVPRAYDDVPPHIWPIALLSLRAHLEKLGREGGAVERDGRWRAQRT